MADDPSFEPPVRPQRCYPGDGSVRYEGTVSFILQPSRTHSVDSLQSLISRAFTEDRHVVGDWFDLPQPAYLVRDRTVETSFKVVIRDDHIEFHVLPDTDPQALSDLFEQLKAESTGAWTVESNVTDV